MCDTPLRKDFDGKIFEGVVVSSDIEIGTNKTIYRVRYEDKDEEDLYQHEIEPLLVDVGDDLKAQQYSILPLVSEQ